MSDKSIKPLEVDLVLCCHSRFNTRKTRNTEHVQRLAERIQRNGFEATRALWAIETDGKYEVFAGGTRFEAAGVCQLKTVPVMLHVGYSEEEICRRADEDNENDEYHTVVPLLDVWAEYHRLWKEEGWTQERIAKAKGTDKDTCSFRCRSHESTHLHKSVRDGMIEEGHCKAIIEVGRDIPSKLRSWLTTEQAQTELVQEVLSKHRGKTVGEKPTVQNVRKAAKRWKELIAKAKELYEKLEDESWQKRFVKRLAKDAIRTVAGVNEVYTRLAEERLQEARWAAESATREEREQEVEFQRVSRIEQLTARVLHGNANQLITTIPFTYQLLLTDPPYGLEYQGNRRKASSKKQAIVGDDIDGAVKLVASVLSKAFQQMADDSTVLLFTSPRHEPRFRQAVEDAGFTFKSFLIWSKKNHGTGDLDGAFAPKHERIIHAVKGNPKLRERHPDVLAGEQFFGTEHPTEKPMDLLTTLIQATTDVGDVVVDPFAGSGTTLFAAHKAGRRFWGIEIDKDNHSFVADTIYQLVVEEDETSERLGE